MEVGSISLKAGGALWDHPRPGRRFLGAAALEHARSSISAAAHVHVIPASVVHCQPLKSPETKL
jgi:hypothetical protein